MANLKKLSLWLAVGVLLIGGTLVAAGISQHDAGATVVLCVAGLGILGVGVMLLRDSWVGE